MIRNDEGVEQNLYKNLLDTSESFKEYMYYMVDCGHFLINQDYSPESSVLEAPAFFIVISGSLDIKYDGEVYSYTSENIGLLESGKTFSCSCKDHCELAYFHFGGPNADTIVSHLIKENASPVFWVSAISSRFYWSVRDGILSISANEHASEINKSVLVYSALCMLQRFEGEHIYVGSFSYRAVADKIILYITKHIDEKITLDSLAREASLSPAYLTKIFKKETGYSPIEYVSVAKIDYAKQMLRTTDTSVTEIAYFLGYSSPSGFINAFKARVGTSPTHFRANKSQIAPPTED